MAPYDSDSSEDEGQDFTETNVLLGYADKDSRGEVVSRLGGRPQWLEHDKPPSAALAKCKVCKDLMVLLLQLNGELPDRFPGHERRIYVFACRRKSCRRKEGSIRAVRGVRISAQAAAAAAQAKEEKKAPAEPEKKQAGPGLGDALFGAKSFGGGSGSANPFSSPGSGGNPFSKPAAAAPANPFSKSASASEQATESKSEAKSTEDAVKDLPKTFAETLNLNNPQQQVTAGPPPPPEPWLAEDAQAAPYPVLWISEAEYETLDPTPMPGVPTTTTMDIDDPAGSSSGGGGKEDKEVFESSMDATFQKFADRVGQNPEQVIRYEFAGQPLLYSKEDAVGKALGAAPGGQGGVSASRGIPRCAACGAGRLFEVQMTPNAIAELEADEEGLEGMDWGTIIVGVCERDCQARGVGEGEAGYLEEWAGVQWEELSAKR